MNLKSLFSAVGLISIAVALVVCVAMISVLPGLRIDLTEDGLYTLSDGTRNIVSSLEEPVELLFFYSDRATEDVPQIRSYANRVEELLEEIVIASNGNLSLEIVDPEPFSEDEDLATQYGIQAVPVVQGGEGIYFGLVARRAVDPAVNPLDAQVFEAMPLIRPDQEQFLEYEFMKLITTVENPERDVVGLITELGIDGGFDPLSGQATSPWIIIETMRQLYEVRRLPSDVENIDDDVDILMLVHPEGLSEQTRYAIDQFVMGGGATIVFLDPNADSLVSRSQQGNLVPAGMSSDLPGLLQSWGVEYDSGLVLTDSDLALRVRMGQGQRPQPHLSMLGIQRDYLPQDDIITRGLETVNLSSAGAIAALEGAATRFEPLLESSTNAMLMDATFVEDVADPSVLFDEFEPGNESHAIAARVTGEIDSAFPEGRPEAAQAETAAAADAETEPVAEDAAASEEQLAEQLEEQTVDANSGNDTEPDAGADQEELSSHIASSGNLNLIVFADTDLLSDRLWVQVAQFLGQRIPQPFANNGDLIVNALDNLSGGADLVSIRSRGRYSRPFTRVLDLQRAADDRLRLEEAELLTRMNESEAALAELNQTEDGQPLGQITPEIQAEIDRFNEELLQTRRRLREVRFQLTEDIERLGSQLKWINTAAVPVLLTLIMLLAYFGRTRERKTAS